MKKYLILSVLLLTAGHVCSQEPISYCIENDITHGFLNDFSYDSLDLSVSYVETYAAKPHDYRLDAPVPVKLSWTNDADAESQRLEVSESSSYSDAMIFALGKSASEYDLYNMIPGKIYYYRIVSTKGGNETVVGQGSLAPTGMLRWIYAEGAWNIRDAGGWPGLGGKPIRYGQVFRGGQLKGKGSSSNLITEAGIEAMRNAGIRAEMDLRSEGDVPSSVSALAKLDANGKYDVDFLNVPKSSGARMVNFDKAEWPIVELQWVIDELRAGKPVFYHCQNGADRTGTLGFLIGALLGMNESDLAKDYELTTFCEAAAAAYDPTEKGFARLRNKEGKKGSPLSIGDNADEYKYALLVEKMVNVTPQNGTYQQKIYNYFKTGIKGHSISETDLDWFIKYMTDYTMAKEIKSFTKPPKEMQRGETHKLNVVLSPANASGKVKYTSSNEAVAKVSDDGVITAVKGGSAKISFEVDGIVKSTTVKVATIESTTPVSTYYNEGRYFLKSSSYVKNGSFEYGSSYLNWKTGSGSAMSETCFALKHYDNSEYTYIESKLDGDEKSEGSIRMEWGILVNKVYVFGYQVRNTTNQKNEKNENLKAMNIKYGEADESKGKLFEYPSYDGNWTDIQYVFFAEPDYDACRIVFSHLSNDSNNTCFDNFYLCELDTITGVKNIILPTTNDQVYDLNGHIRIIDGKKYLIK